MNNYLLTPPLLFFVFFCFPPPPPPHTFAELIRSQVYAFSIFEYSDCYNFNEMIEFSLWNVIRQLLGRCFSDGCFDRRLLGISAICLFTSCEIATGAWNGLPVFAQKQTDIPTIYYVAFVYLRKSIKQYINGHAENQIFFGIPEFHSIFFWNRSTLKKSDLV